MKSTQCMPVYHTMIYFMSLFPQPRIWDDNFTSKGLSFAWTKWINISKGLSTVPGRELVLGKCLLLSLFVTMRHISQSQFLPTWTQRFRAKDHVVKSPLGVSKARINKQISWLLTSKFFHEVLVSVQLLAHTLPFLHISFTHIFNINQQASVIFAVALNDWWSWYGCLNLLNNGKEAKGTTWTDFLYYMKSKGQCILFNENQRTN